jgi:signal transduction histidine kinase
MTGIVVGASAEPITLDPAGAMMLTSFGELLSAGIQAARLRMEIQRTAVQRERMRLAADLHDGLAQNLALAVREISLLESQPAPAVAEASRGRLREAVHDAHRLVRAGLEDLSVVIPVGGVGPAVEELCARFEARGMTLDVQTPRRCPNVAPDVMSTVLRVLQEALANIERHADATGARVLLRVIDDDLELEISDDGRGIETTAPHAPGDGHFGLWLMRERARSLGGTAEVVTQANGGTVVTLRLPLDHAAG